MISTKFIVFLIFVGVVCANIGARQLEEVSKETKLGVSIHKTVTTNGLGAELDYVTVTTVSENMENSNASAAAGPTADASGRVNKYTSGTVTAQGPNARAESESYSAGSTGSGAAADPNGAAGGSSANGVAYSRANGSTTD